MGNEPVIVDLVICCSSLFMFVRSVHLRELPLVPQAVSVHPRMCRGGSVRKNIDQRQTAQRVYYTYTMNGIELPEDFCFSFQEMPPKGEKPQDEDRVCRPPEETHPLNLKYSDKEICTGVINTKIKTPIKVWANRNQRGFVKDRQGIDNLVELDTGARIVDMQNRDVHSRFSTSHTNDNVDIGILALYDFMTAFPSVAHAWLFIALSAACFPEGIVMYFKMLYLSNKVFIRVDGEVLFFLEILAGILQGCPASGSLFVVVLNPFLEIMETTLRPGELIKAFADDLANVLKSLKALRRIFSIFKVIKRVTQMQLKASKCLLIPLGEALTENLVRAFETIRSSTSPNGRISRWVVRESILDLG